MSVPNPVPPEESKSGWPSSDNNSVFFILGITFMVLGVTNPVFFVVGLVFFIIGLPQSSNWWNSTTRGAGDPSQQTPPPSEQHPDR